MNLEEEESSNFEEIINIEELYEKEINLQDYIYDSFVLNKHKFLVLKNEKFNINSFNEDGKKLFLAELLQIENYNIIAPLTEDEYENAVDYYLELKRSFLKE